jgi:tousled-like kinase
MHFLQELQKQSAELLQRREELDRRKRQLAKESRKALATLNSASTGSSTSASGWILSGGPVGEAGLGPGVGEGSADGVPFDELQLMEAEEGVRMHLGQLKKDEATVQEARKSLEREKSLYVRELRRVQHEDRSRFSRRPVMNGRYLLLALLGRGGFSEVWKAFDMREYCEVCSESRKGLGAH